MESVNKRIVGAFTGVLVAVALTLLNVWQLALPVILGAVGYLIAGIGMGLKRRITDMMHRRRE